MESALTGNNVSFDTGAACATNILRSSNTLKGSASSTAMRTSRLFDGHTAEVSHPVWLPTGHVGVMCGHGWVMYVSASNDITFRTVLNCVTDAKYTSCLQLYVVP